MSQRILIIEDELLIALEIASSLEDAGFTEIQQAESESRALQRIADEAWDCVLADANLNGRSIDRIAAVLHERSIPLIVVTGYTKHSLPPSIGNAPVIEKPFDGANLVRILRSVLANEHDRAGVGQRATQFSERSVKHT
jgi:DNA-binding response OmpR family regulator